MTLQSICNALGAAVLAGVAAVTGCGTDPGASAVWAVHGLSCRASRVFARRRMLANAVWAVGSAWGSVS